MSGKPTSRGLPTEVTESAQNYLREIYKLEEDGDRATTTVIAERLGVSPPSATGMIKKLTALGLLEHVPYRGVVLTAAGKRVALEVTRHHRLLELYLVRRSRSRSTLFTPKHTASSTRSPRISSGASTMRLDNRHTTHTATRSPTNGSKSKQGRRVP